LALNRTAAFVNCALIKAFGDEKDPKRLNALAAELEQLLKLESKPWPISDRQKSA
jgi:hypothetical protein